MNLQLRTTLVVENNEAGSPNSNIGHTEVSSSSEVGRKGMFRRRGGFSRIEFEDENDTASNDSRKNIGDFSDMLIEPDSGDILDKVGVMPLDTIDQTWAVLERPTEDSGEFVFDF